MQIGRVIREHRKRKNLTQEEMANRLGVTAPAVNKWENGNSFPDITLLAPIARLLEVSLDELLSFREELTEEEIKDIIYELDARLKEGTYEEAFRWAKEKLEQYPNCEFLILSVAVVLDAGRLFREVASSEKYDSCINQWYVRALESDDEDIRTRSADALFGFYQRKEQYEKAEEYLSFFSKQNPERKRKQAVIYSKTGRREEAYKAYEEILFSTYQLTSAVLNSIYMLAMQDGNTGKAHMMVEKQSELAKIFEMGLYHEVSAKLDIAAAEKDAETTIETMEKMLSCVDEICDYCKSPLYEHMTFKPVREEFVTELKHNLLANFRDEEAYGFLKDNKRWQKLMKFH